MRKINFLFLPIFFLFFISCSSDDDNSSNQISILGEWVHYSTTNQNGDVTIHSDRCPDILSILTSTITITDYIDAQAPCVDFETTTVNYTITDNILEISGNGNTETYTIETLTGDILRLKTSSSTIIEYQRTI